MEEKENKEFFIKVFTSIWPVPFCDGVNIKRGVSNKEPFVVISGCLDDIMNFSFELSQKVDNLKAEFGSREIEADFLSSFLDPCLFCPYCESHEVFVGLYRDLEQAMRVIPVGHIRMDYELMRDDGEIELAFSQTGKIVFSRQHPCFVDRKELEICVRELRNGSKPLFHQMKRLEEFCDVLIRQLQMISPDCISG